MSHAGTALMNPSKVLEKINLQAGMRAADFGCGRTGHILFQLVPIVGDLGVVYAVDVMKDILESVKNQARTGGFTNVQTVWSDLESYGAMAIPDESLDAGFFINVLFMLKNRALALKETARVIKSEGLLVVVDWSKKLGLLGPLPHQMISKDILMQEATDAGFKYQEEINVGDYHFCLIFKKL